MTYVVCEPCHDCKYTDCVVECPVECFYQDDLMLYIDPETCIDCDACREECPTTAIFQDSSVPEVWQSYIDINRDRVLEIKPGGNITEKAEPKLGAGCKERGGA